MNILFVGEHYYPEIGGLERSTERLAIGLQQYFRTKVIVLTTNCNGEPQYSKRNGVQIFRSGSFGNMSYESLKSGIIDVKNRIGNIDIISLFGIGDEADERYWNAIFETPYPSALKIGTSGDTNVKNIQKAKLDCFDGHLCQNPDIENELEGLGISKQKIFSIRNGLDIDTYLGSSKSKTDARNELGIQKDRFVVSAIGRFVKRKNFDVIIDSFLHFYNTCKTSNKPLLLLQGSDFGQSDGVQKDIEQQLRNLPKDSFIFLPASENTEIALSASDVFITLGDREGAPNIILEAQVLGKLVIATDIPGHRVYINESNGLLVDKKITDISNAFNLVGHNKFDPKIISKDSRKFDIKETAGMYMRAYNKIINQ